MRWPVVRTLLPAVIVLVGAVAWAQPSVEREETPAAVHPSAAESGAPAEAAPRRRDPRSGRRGRSRSSHRAAAAPTRDRSSISVGHHNRGRLLNGSEIDSTEHLRLKADGDQRHGTDEMVALLRAAADHVWSSIPGSRLTLGDLSRHSGGRFRPHRSHQNGRDADIGFFIQDVDGVPVSPNRFFDFGPMGTTRNEPTWRFDDARNWVLVEYLLTQTEAPVQYLFISRELRRRLLAEGARRGADPEILARAARIMYQPPAGGRHNDHLHLRIFCDPSDFPRCQDGGPRPPWLLGSSALQDAVAHGLTGLEDVVSASAFFTAPPPEADEEEAPAPRRSRARRRRHRSRRARGR